MTYEMLQCDICNRTKDEIETAAFEPIVKFKVKREHYEWWRVGTKRWDRIDICQDCLKQLRDKSRNKQKGEN